MQICLQNMKLTFIKIACPLGMLSNISPSICSTPITQINIPLHLHKFCINTRGVNIRPNPQTRYKLDTGFCEFGLGLNGFGS